MGKIKDISNQKFGRLTAKYPTGQKNNRGTIWFCECECGGTKEVNITLLTNGKTKSCGCLKSSEEISKRTTKHNLRNTRLYTIWNHMKDRCYNVNSKIYKYYGGKGINVCEEWKDFLTFYNWAINNNYSDNLTIDRIDVNGNYEPSNCRWVDFYTQANNRTNNRLITFNGKTQTLSQWCREYQIKFDTVKDRLNKLHWSFEKAITTPVLPIGQKLNIKG